jgi:hypothetical protein
LNAIDIAAMTMIHFTRLSTGQSFVDEHPDIVARFSKACSARRLLQDTERKFD